VTLRNRTSKGSYSGDSILECGSWSVVGRQEDGTTIVHPLSCKRWSCRSCAPRRKRKLLARLDGTKPVSLLTLTCRPSAHLDPDSAFFTMSASVNKLFKRIRRVWPHAEVEYFLVWERTAKGWPHAHLLLRAPYVPQTWLSRHWADLTGAPIIDIRQVHTAGQVVAYISKYLTKDPQAPAGMKRFRSSLRFFPAVLPQADPAGKLFTTWTMSRKSACELAAEFSDAGYTVHIDPAGSIQCFPRGHPGAPMYDSIALMRSSGRIVA